MTVSELIAALQALSADQQKVTVEVHGAAYDSVQAVQRVDVTGASTHVAICGDLTWGT